MTKEAVVEKLTDFIQKHWTDQKLQDVKKFNEDGGMQAWNSCSCFIGVSGAESLHANYVPTHTHYKNIHKGYEITQESHDAEAAYMTYHHKTGQQAVNILLGEIIDAEIARRAEEKAAKAAKEEAEKGVYIGKIVLMEREKVEVGR